MADPGWYCEAGHWHSFFCRTQMAPGERHTPCHDVIQGTCRARRSGWHQGPSLLACVVAHDHISPALSRAPAAPHDAPAVPTIHLTMALAASSQNQNPRTHPTPNEPITPRPPSCLCVLTTAPRAALIYTGRSLLLLARYYRLYPNTLVLTKSPLSFCQVLLPSSTPT